MKLKEVNKNLIELFFANIQTLEYKTIKNGQETTVIAEIYKTEDIPLLSDYFIEQYADLKITDMTVKFAKETTSPLDFANFVKSICKGNWAHYLEVLNAVYSPLYNVDGVTLKESTTTYGKETTNAQTESGTHSTTTTRGNDTTENTIAGFNSSNYENESKSDTTYGTVNENGTKSDGTFKETNAGADSFTEKETRYGNIGVTMTQQLLKAEFDLWKNFNFMQTFFVSIIDVICYPIFED